mgnify:CR=1 FL=1
MMSNIFEENKNKVFRLNEGVFIGDENSDGKSYILNGDKIFELKGSSSEILKVLEKKSLKSEEFLSQLNSKFEGLDEKAASDFLKFCIVNQIVVIS